MCDFRHEGVTIWKFSRALPGYPLVFWTGNPKLQEIAKKNDSYDKIGFKSIKYPISKLLYYFGHEGVSIWKCSRVLTGHLLVFWRGNPKLQETVKKKSFMWQKKIQQHWHIIYLVFCVILAMKGFISVNAHLLYFEEATQATRKS